MTSANSVYKWLALPLGIIVCALFAFQMTSFMEKRAGDFAAGHSDSGSQGMRTLIYDNPFQTGKPHIDIRPAPRYSKPLRRYYKPQHFANYRTYVFSWRFLAALKIEQPGDYVFIVSAVDAVRLRVDGIPLVERWVDSYARLHQAMVHLDKGVHLIDLQNVQRPKQLELGLVWIPPGAQEAGVIPPHSLAPLNESAGLGQIAGLYADRDSWRMLTFVLPGLWILIWLLIVRDPARAYKAFTQHKGLWAILLLASLARLLWADVVHGISGESAFFIWRAQLILEGAWPFQGMTTRTGPLFDYLMAVPVAIFGATPWVHRIVGALPNVLALVFLYRACLREAGKAAALAACLLMAVLPGLVIFARMPGDNTSLGILFMCLGLDLLSASRQRPLLALWAGIIWGLAFFNHSITAIWFITLGASALVVTRGRLLLMPQLYSFGLGVVIGFAPRWISRLLLKPEDVMSFTDPKRMLELPGFLTMFLRTLDGDVVYRSFVGSYIWNTWMIIPIGLGLAMLYLIWRQFKNRAHTAWLELWLLLALVVHLIMVPLGAPSANPRYFLYALVFATFLGGLAWGRAWEDSRKRIRPVLTAALLVFAAFNLASLGVNYFYAHLTTGGYTGLWNTKLLDHTPDAWMNHRLMVKELVKRGYPVVATADYWHHTLHLALNLYQDQKPPVFEATDVQSLSNTERAVVFYNSFEGQERMRFFLRHHDMLKEYNQVDLPKPLIHKYILLERTDPPVTYPMDVIHNHPPDGEPHPPNAKLNTPKMEAGSTDEEAGHPDATADSPDKEASSPNADASPPNAEPAP